MKRKKIAKLFLRAVRYFHRPLIIGSVFKSKCCGGKVWVEGHTTQFYVCGNCDKPCDVK